MSSVAPLLIWIICIGISALALGLLIREGGVDWIFQTEGFNNIVPIRITTCPATTTSHVTADGDTNCCDGDIIDKQCNGTTLCSLSPKPPHGLMSCTDWIMKEWKARSDRFCAPSMPYYFGPLNRKSGSTEGCSVSPPIENGSIPRDQGMAKCKIYSNTKDDYSKSDSCFNVQAKDNMMVPVPNATRTLIPTGQFPALLQATYMPTNQSSPTPVSCFDWDRVKLYLDAVDTSGRTTQQYASQKDNNYQLFCGASKAYYVDGTLSVTKCVTGIPSSYIPSQHKIISQSVNMTPDFTLSMNITPRGTVGNWGSIIHFTTGGDCCDLGHRAPGIWWAPNTIDTFALHIGHSNDGGWACRPSGMPFAIGKKSTLTVTCKGQQITVKVDDKVYNYTHDGTRYNGPLKVYGSDPWYPAANCTVENVCLVTN